MAEVIKVEDCVSNIGDYDVPIHNAIVIPDNATNGDMIKTMFPNCRQLNMILENEDGEDFEISFDITSGEGLNWNAPYNRDAEKNEESENKE